MDVEIFVHGVPNGESFWGKEEERNFFGTFYGQGCDDEVKYLIQTRPLNGKVYCYYNYLVYKNVLANEGREGSYFGLSIRFDAYCKDFFSIYKVLDTIFTAYVQNEILKFQNGKLKYTITDFGGSSDLMDKIYKATLQLIKCSLTSDSFENLRGFATGGANLPTGNIYEATVNNVEDSIKKYGKVALSPYYPTTKERELNEQYNSKLQAVKQQCEEKYKAVIETKDQEIHSIKSSLVSVQVENGNLSKTITQKDQIIAKKDSSIAELENQIKQIKHTKKVVKNVELIKEPVIELAEIFGEQRVIDKPNKTEHGFTYYINSFIPLVNLVLILFVVILLWANKSPIEVKPNEDIACLHDSINQLNNRIEEFQSQQSVLTDNPFSLSTSQNVRADIKLDVSDYNETSNQYLKKNTTYNVKVLNSKDPSKGTWKIEGGHIKGNANGEEIKFVPEADHTVTITYKDSNGKSKCRSLKVQN